MLSGVIAKKFGYKGLREDSIVINLEGTAGQSLGAFLSAGITISLSGEGNDYVGKGLSGGKIIIRPFKDSIYKPEKNIIIGNTVLYGAISGNVIFQEWLVKDLQFEILELSVVVREPVIIAVNT